ncbi:hypothetical protein D3C81_1487800 [compost metagenome]
MLNPYWDGVEFDLYLNNGEFELFDESALADESPLIEGSPNALALDWVSSLGIPIWISDEVKLAVEEAKQEHEKYCKNKKISSVEDPFGDYF